MSLDPTTLLHHLDGFALSEAQKLDTAKAVVLMMESFVDLAFGTDATQICLGIDRRGATPGSADALDSTHYLVPTFNDAAEERGGKAMP